jgi:hypothetical protein
MAMFLLCRGRFGIANFIGLHHILFCRDLSQNAITFIAADTFRPLKMLEYLYVQQGCDILCSPIVSYLYSLICHKPLS